MGILFESKWPILPNASIAAILMSRLVLSSISMSFGIVADDKSSTVI